MWSWKTFCIFAILNILIIHAEVFTESNNFLAKPAQIFENERIETHQSPIDLDSVIENLKSSPLLSQDLQSPIQLRNDENQMPLSVDDIMKSPPPTPKNVFETFRLTDSDWANLARYAASDDERSKLPVGSNQVIFMGDSITDGWNISHWFPKKPYVNRGIGGQITPQMLVRFREDVVNLQPNITIILGGTNDIASKTNLSIIQANLETMVELSRVHGFKPIIASITPVCGSVVAIRPPKLINTMNAWIQDFCKQAGVIYLDYFSSLVGTDGLLKPDFTNDCLHPNAAGYDIMAPLAQAAIDQALSSL